MIPSYPKVWHLGHRNVAGMFDTPYTVQEKYDGSQFSFMKTEDGKLLARSRRTEIVFGSEYDALFGPAMRNVERIESVLKPGHVYRGEAFKSNRHNTKKYDHPPLGNIVLFDVQRPDGTFLDSVVLLDEAEGLGLEYARNFGTFGGTLHQEVLDDLLKVESSLGGTKIEGVVFKNYVHQTPFGDPAFAKYVSEEFKEQHRSNLDWKQGKDLYDALGSQFATEARWRKSVERLRDSGELEGSPKDIGRLLKELSQDLLDEYGDEIKERVWKNAWKRIAKASTRGFAEWYKRELAFGEEKDLH